MYCDECGFKNKETAKFCKNCGASLEEEQEQLTRKKDVEKVLEEDFDNSQDEMKLNKKQLLEYLNMAKELEINKLGLENTINDLHSLDKKEYVRIVKPIQKKQKPRKEFQLSDVVDDRFDWVVIRNFFLVFLFIIMTVLIYHYKFNVKWEDVLANILFVIGALFDDNFWVSMFISAGICVAVFIIITLLIFIRGNIKYKKDMHNYKKESNTIDKENDKQLAIYKGQKNIIDGRIVNVNKDLEDTEKALKKYYDVDVIYPKYRNLIAITTFIEYLESGRCKSLYGYTGCYNVYEQELRQNTIIGKLDQVLVKLDEIKKAQYATFMAIQMSNAIQSAFVNTCNDMLNEQKRANATLEAQAQDTKIIKRNNEIISTISTLNYIKHN